jgi:hypothetical protein
LLPRLSADGSRLAWSDLVDGKIVSLVSEPGSGSSTPRADALAALYLVPAGHPIPRDSWVQIAEDRNYLSRAAWSADGKLIYYYC